MGISLAKILIPVEGTANADTLAGSGLACLRDTGEASVAVGAGARGRAGRRHQRDSRGPGNVCGSWMCILSVVESFGGVWRECDMV